METKAAGIDGGQVGVVVGSVDARQDFSNFFLAEYGGETMFRLGADNIEDVPIMLQDVGVKETDAAVADAHGLGCPHADIFSMEKILPEFIFGNGIRRFVVEFGQHPHGADIAFLGTFALAVKLEGFGHSFGPVCHHDNAPFLEMFFPGSSGDLKGAIPDRQLWWEDLRWVREYFRKGCCCRGAAYLNAGCASKIGAADIEDLLARLPKVSDPAVILGLAAGDDAAVYKINDTTNLVQTVDVFTPCVDDPYTFGKICAANCLSDIYAMGGIPRTALSVLAFPVETQDREIMYLMLKGAMEVLEKAECAFIGGHSIKDEEIKLGFAVTGTIDTGMSVSLETAAAGDVLVLTKPLGVGVLSFADQIGRADKNGLKAAERSMMELNKGAADAMMKIGVSACTDITGFGLFGHLARMMRHSKTSARIYADALPVFEGVLPLLREGVISGALERNAEFVGVDLIVSEDVKEEFKNLGFCPETSGGLLISVPEEKYKALADELKRMKLFLPLSGGLSLEKQGSLN